MYSLEVVEAQQEPPVYETTIVVHVHEVELQLLEAVRLLRVDQTFDRRLRPRYEVAVPRGETAETDSDGPWRGGGGR